MCWDVLVVAVVDGSVSSRQPNQPGVLHVDVEEEEVDVLVVLVFLPLVVVSSRHPHQPGVLHVSVRVRVDLDIEVDVGFDDEVVVVSVPLLSKYSHV